MGWPGRQTAELGRGETGREWVQCWCPAWGSEGGDVVKCIVQLLADGFVLHLLRIHFICRWGQVGSRWWNRVEGTRWRERVAVSGGLRAAGVCGHRQHGCDPIPHLRAEPRPQEFCAPAPDTVASSLPAPRTSAQPLPLAKHCPAPPGAWCAQCHPRKEEHKAGGNILPSRSSMVFSSFATDLSANSARVSAYGKHSGERVSCRTQQGRCRLHCTPNLPHLHHWYPSLVALPWERQGTEVTRAPWSLTP